MPEQVIIEFIADTTKLEEAYSRVSNQVTDSANLNKDSFASFQKANSRSL